MRIKDITTDHLGQVATDEDVRAFQETCWRIRPAFGTDDEAIDWLYGDGDYMPRLQAGICAYCNTLVTHDRDVPASDDNEAWAHIAEQHDVDCEWVVTRAHRLDD